MIGPDAEYRIVEENPNRTVELKIFDDFDGMNPARRMLQPPWASTSATSVITVVNSGVGEDEEFRYPGL